MRLAIVVSEFNEEITSRMLKVAKEEANQMSLEIVNISNVQIGRAHV